MVQCSVGLTSPQGRWRHVHARPAKGFTLVELLVVIGIIALLIAILLPSLRRARQSAQSVACMSNERQVGIAIQQYLHDSKGQYMPYYSLSIGAWYRRLVADPDVWPNNARGYLPGYDVFFCPAYEHVRSLTNPYLPGETGVQYAVRRGYISYGMNMGLTNDYRQAGYPEIVAKFTQLKKPTDTIVLVDAEHPVYRYGLFYVHPYYIAPASFDYGAPALRHPNASANVLWADGHVTNVPAAKRNVPGSIYDQKALTDYSMNPSFWDRQ